MPSAGLSSLPVELLERDLECFDIFDIIRLKLVRAPPIVQRPLPQPRSIQSSSTVNYTVSSVAETTSSTESSSFSQGLRMAIITAWQNVNSSSARTSLIRTVSSLRRQKQSQSLTTALTSWQVTTRHHCHIPSRYRFRHCGSRHVQTRRSWNGMSGCALLGAPSHGGPLDPERPPSRWGRPSSLPVWTLPLEPSLALGHVSLLGPQSCSSSTT